MRPYHIVSRYVSACIQPVRSGRCDECGSFLLVTDKPLPDAIVVCSECWPWGELRDPMVHPHVVIDRHMLGQMTGDNWKQPVDGDASALWVNCPKCRAHRGDECRIAISSTILRAEDRFCSTRIAANLQRMLQLPTYAIPHRHRCCGTSIWLCWRVASDAVEFHDVPCTKCGRTYTIEINQSDFAMSDRRVVDRLNPHLMEMSCWALE